jgi:hypothetical protein
MQNKCTLCSRLYKKKSTLVRHGILCGFLHSKQDPDESQEELPTYKELWQIVRELGVKYVSVESRLESVQRSNQQQKKKVDVAQWLNNNITPLKPFTTWTQEIQIDESDITRILSSFSITNALIEVFKHNLTPELKMTYPLVCFEQKVNHFYIYKETATGWEKYESEEFIGLVKQIHKKFLVELMQWKKRNELELQTDEALREKYDKALSKLTGIQFLQASAKIRAGVYTLLKTDLKTQIEYIF